MLKSWVAVDSRFVSDASTAMCERTFRLRFVSTI
jgi:hypothetical protein